MPTATPPTCAAGPPCGGAGLPLGPAGRPARSVPPRPSPCSRLGTLLLGAAQPPPDENYRALQFETDRLNYELATWQVPTPVLSGELARRWEIPRPLPGLLELLWMPAVRELPPDPLNAQLRLLALVAASLELAALTPASPAR
jgi:hypothetical protein